MNKKGVLVVNVSLKGSKFDSLYTRLIKAFSVYDIELDIATNEDYIELLENISNYQFGLFWDKDIKLAKLLESKGLRLFNNSKAIEICDDKALTYIALLNENVKMPKTYFSPLLFNWSISSLIKFIYSVEEKIAYPFVLKECKGSFGKEVYLINNRAEFKQKAEELKLTPFIVQEFVKTSFGKDIRIEVVGGKAVACMLRKANGDFRANVTNGGSTFEYTPTKEETDLAIKVAKLLNLDFCGVDILFGENEPIICEVNSNAHILNLEKCSKVNVADAICQYIIKEIY